MQLLRPGSRVAVAAAALVSALAAACGPGSVGPSADTIATISVTPDSISLAAGSSDDLAALARSVSGTTLPGQRFYWSTSDSLIATVSQSGVVVAHQPGVAQVGASAQGLNGIARVIVVQPIIKAVRVAPAADSIYAGHPGDTAQLAATAYDSAGHVITSSPLFWSTNSALVSVKGGVVIGTNGGTGTATITATSPDSGFPSGSATVKVIGHISSVTLSPQYTYLSTSGSFLLAQQVQFSAALTDTFGNDVTGQRTLSWSSADPTVATVNKHGLVTAVTTTGGSTQITARTPDGVTGSATVTVFP
jgi:uncharacterized protein YjdB